MNSKNEHEKNLKEKITHELGQLLINFLFMAAIFTSFSMYRRILLGELSFSNFHYGYALFEALILAKIVTLGQNLQIGQRRGNSKFIYAVLYKTFIFSLFVLLFTVVEHFIEGLLHGKGFEGALQIVIFADWPIILARVLVMFFIFIPYITLIETVRMLTGGDLYELFFQTNKGMNQPHS